MYKLMTQCIFVYIIWCSSLMACKTSSEVISGRNISRLIEEINASEFQASALIRSHQRRILSYSKYPEMPNSDIYLNGGIQKKADHADMKSDNVNISTFLKTMQMPNSDIYLNGGIQKKADNADMKSDNSNNSTFLKTIQPSFGAYVLFGRAEATSDQSQRSSENENRNIAAKEEFALQEMHLRYLMSSTAEQPDNSGRTSTFNMWLTIIIAALAAAILS